jgi:hypothetical protein
MVRYLIGSVDDDLLRNLTRRFEGDNGVALHRVLGPPEAPRTLVVETTPERADGLRAEYGARVVIEPDDPLTPIEPAEPRNG